MSRTKGLYRLDDRFHAGKILTKGEGDDDGMLVATFDVDVPTIIQESIVAAANSHDSLQAQVAALRSALRAMVNAYAPLAAKTAILEGEQALHPSVREARAALGKEE